MKEVSIKNRRARFEYEIIEEFVAGLQLTGTEIKSIRQSKASINEGYCFFKEGELWIKNMHIAEYTHGSYTNHDPKRDRKLLLKKKELEKLEKNLNIKGYAIVPLKMFVTEKGWAKLLIGLGKGKKLHDKRESLKEKDAKRSMDRMMKTF